MKIFLKNIYKILKIIKVKKHKTKEDNNVYNKNVNINNEIFCEMIPLKNNIQG